MRTIRTVIVVALAPFVCSNLGTFADQHVPLSQRDIKAYVADLIPSHDALVNASKAKPTTATERAQETI